ncbi:hypothetical protein GC207_09585 [bacterium]|nr:hypothetical protein [bacterium]
MPDSLSSPPSVDWLICFAVKEEAAALTLPHPETRSVVTLLTGMGRDNASRAIEQALPIHKPKAVISAGFAGGLNSQLRRGTVVFDSTDELGIIEQLLGLGAIQANFHCAKRVAVTTVEKSLIRDQTGADVVEMESSAIRAICRQANIPSSTIRVISDAADEDLPLDFNAVMTPDCRMHWGKFAGVLLRTPSLIGRLIEFQRHTKQAARELGRVLQEVVKQRPAASGNQGVP